jgi:membrane associated rhomboid family serine protease
MNNSRNLVEELQFQLRHGSVTTKLLFANVFVFIFIQLIIVTYRLLLFDTTWSIAEVIFTLDTNFLWFILKPWGIFTSIFSHFDILHLLFNMLFLYFSGQFFESIFNGKRLLYTYIFGGIAGGILEILSHFVFPALQESHNIVVGASGSVMAIFTALAFYSPNTKVLLFGVFPIRIYFIAIFFLLKDLSGLGSDDNIAHFAHLGGAIFGLISIQNMYSKNNIINVLYRVFGNIKNVFIFNKPKTPKFTTTRGGSKSDEDYNLEKKKRQEKTDAILDKISKAGYESLTKEEKDFLFNQSKNG